MFNVFNYVLDVWLIIQKDANTMCKQYFNILFWLWYQNA